MAAGFRVVSQQQQLREPEDPFIKGFQACNLGFRGVFSASVGWGLGFGLTLVEL